MAAGARAEVGIKRSHSLFDGLFDLGGGFGKTEANDRSRFIDEDFALKQGLSHSGPGKLVQTLNEISMNDKV